MLESEISPEISSNSFGWLTWKKSDSILGVWFWNNLKYFPFCWIYTFPFLLYLIKMTPWPFFKPFYQIILSLFLEWNILPDWKDIKMHWRKYLSKWSFDNILEKVLHRDLHICIAQIVKLRLNTSIVEIILRNDLNIKII